MLTAVTNTHLTWLCQVYDEYGGLTSCGQARTCRVEEARYQRPRAATPVPPSAPLFAGPLSLLAAGARWLFTGRAPFEAPVTMRDAQSGRGAVIALPRCPDCGVQTFLKADYTLQDLWACTLPVCDEARAGSVVWAYVLRPLHARNLRAQWLLYRVGRAGGHPPLLPLPDADWLAHPALAGADPDTRDALWFGLLAASAYARSQGQEEPPPPLLPPFTALPLSPPGVGDGEEEAVAEPLQGGRL